MVLNKSALTYVQLDSYFFSRTWLRRLNHSNLHSTTWWKNSSSETSRYVGFPDTQFR